ncbi:hypothetical protein LXA43DRAFT_890194 [Ganoderma leucocontextum]|nr:hypothetical protein LXA43DRAFT_890194 [Ganoderma leucocontextum]
MDDFCAILVSSDVPQSHPTYPSLQSFAGLTAQDRASSLARVASSIPINEDSNDQYQAYCVIA